MYVCMYLPTADGDASSRDDAREARTKGGVHAHAFAHDGVQVGQFDAVGVAEGVGERAVRQRLVDLSTKLSKCGRVFVKVVEDGRQCDCGCVGTCPDHSPNLSRDVFDRPVDFRVGGVVD